MPDQKIQGGWARYEAQLAGIRISNCLRQALIAEAAQRGISLSSYVRIIFDGRAQIATQFDAQTAKQK